ncbi:MAG: TetR/AcrR family transcriptional regulator [Novosphingobium sp.]
MTTETIAEPSIRSKGERTRHRIIGQALELIEEQGIPALSQEAVARRAGLSQSALRHHFPMKEDMLAAVFAQVFRPFYHQAEQELLRPQTSPREKLMRLIGNHIDYVLHASDRVALESFAHSTRDATLLAEQSGWYAWLVEHYAALLGAIHPTLDEAERKQRGFALLTLSLGAWISAGRSRPSALWPSPDAARTALLHQAARLIGA